MTLPGPGPRGIPGSQREAGKGHARLFFALWPDDATRAALGALGCVVQAECGGRVTPADNIHLTLVFLGDVPTARVADLCRVADGMTAPCFGLDVGAVHYWRHNRIVWTGPAQCPDALHSLVAGLESVLASRGFDSDRRAYTPHITLLRNARRAPATRTMPAIRWSVAGFVLAQSLRRERAVVYDVLRHWPPGAGTRSAGRVAQHTQDEYH